MLTLATPTWLIPDGINPRGIRWVLPAGHLWDAVRTPTALGRPVLDHLLDTWGDFTQLGPVLEDARGEWLYWLVSPGSSDTYPPGVRFLSTGAWISAPVFTEQAQGDAAWVHLPQEEILTGPAWLAAAIEQGALGAAA